MASLQDSSRSFSATITLHGTVALEHSQQRALHMHTEASPQQVYSCLFFLPIPDIACLNPRHQDQLDEQFIAARKQCLVDA